MTTTAERFGEDFGAERMWGLKELPYPDPVGWLPQTPGWYVVAAVLLAALIYVVWRVRRRHQANAYRRAGVARLEAIASGDAALAELPFLLRKAALTAYPRTDVAGLRGRDWQQWLNGAANQDLYSEADAGLIDELAYLPPDRLAALRDDDATRRLIELSKRWLEVHGA